MVRGALFVVVALILCACAHVRTEVSRFHQMPASVTGATFVIVPSKVQESSLEHRQYERLVAQQLAAKGLKEVSDLRNAQYAIMFSYAIDGGQTTVSQAPIFGQTGGGMATYTGNTFGSVDSKPFNAFSSGTLHTPPTFGVVGSVPVSETTYARALVVNIYDMQKSSDTKLVKAFEATANSSGSKGTLAAVMPAMIESVFKDFPGESGRTSTVLRPVTP